MDSSSGIMKRRAFLKGTGVALLLPRLESLGQVEEKSPRRLLTIVNHLSFYQPHLIPEVGGVFEKAPPLLDLLTYPTCHRDAAARLISRALELQPDSSKAHNSPVNIDENREDWPTRRGRVH